MNTPPNIHNWGPIDLAIVVTGGDDPEGGTLERLQLPDRGAIVVIGADSGVHHAHRLGLTVDIAVGDFDSIDPDVLASLGDIDIRRHRIDKDATDLELALDVAIELGVPRIIVIGGHGGRLDHLLGNAMVISSARYAGVRIEAVMGAASVAVVRPGDPVELRGEPGAYVTVLAVHGLATDVHLEGLEWPLAGATLHPGSTLGVSNRFESPIARFRTGTGTLLVIIPGAEQ